MPTFNQLVRKGREDAKKSKSSALLHGFNTLTKQQTDLAAPQKMRRLHEGVHQDPEEAELCFEKDRESKTDQRYRSYFVYSGYRSQLAGA